MLMKSISNNDSRVMALSLNYEGNLIASICEDEINKKYMIEVYDVNYGDDSINDGRTLYSQTMTYEKQCIQWNPKKNVLAFAGEDKDGASVHILNPSATA